MTPPTVPTAPIAPAITERHVVVVSRKWAHPAISINVTEDGISVGMSLADFLAAAVEEMGNPTLMVTKAQLAARLLNAAEAVATGMKHETTAVM